MTLRMSGLTQELAAVRDIEPSELALLPSAVRVIDVREPDEWAGELGHLDRAELVPLAQLRDAQLAWRHAEPLVLVCRSGRRSLSAAQLLAELGFQHVLNLRGGMLAYRAMLRASL